MFTFYSKPIFISFLDLDSNCLSILVEIDRTMGVGGRCTGRSSRNKCPRALTKKVQYAISQLSIFAKDQLAQGLEYLAT